MAHYNSDKLEPVDIIRESTRDSVKLNRRFHRDEETDVRRCIENSSVSSTSIADIAEKLKTKSSVSLSDLQTLKNGLMDDQKYIEVVLNTHGALRGLVKEISGHDVSKQCAAAACCCNLALGDARAGAALAKMAGPYLTLALDSLSCELAVTSSWSLGNMAGSGSKACVTLVAQGALSRLVTNMTCARAELRHAAADALAHFTCQLNDDLGMEYLMKMISGVCQQEVTASTARLLFTLSCHEHFTPQVLSETYFQKLLLELTTQLLADFEDLCLFFALPDEEGPGDCRV